MIFLAIDPSLTATGVILADGEGRVLRSACFRTEPASKGLKLAVGVDDADRMGRVLREIEQLVADNAPDHIVAELPSGMFHGGQKCPACKRAAFSPRGLETTGMSKLLVVALCWKYRVRPMWVRPMDVKRALTGDKSASKEAVVAAAQKRGVALEGPKPVREAVADSFGVLVASGIWTQSTESTNHGSRSTERVGER